MCKFLVFHSEEFTNPVEVFILGLFIVAGNILCETTNAVAALNEKTITGVISKFVGFKILIQIQDYYVRSRSNFEIKKEVGKAPLTINADPRRIFGRKAYELQSSS
jgi:hypothetical protein